MAATEETVDSPVGWVADHIRRYVATDGRQGHRKWGMTCLLLTTRGRVSGAPRRTALFYGTDGDRLVVVASNGGQANHPQWYLNLRADPRVLVQVEAETFAARASEVTGTDREQLWRLMADRWPEYDRYRAKAGRDIPVVVLDRTGG